MCRDFWRSVQSIGYVATSLWDWVAVPWRQCSAQRCIWWCLCCNKWLCWIALILLAVLLIVFLIMYVVWTFTLLVTCESLCILVAILQGLSGNIRVRCFRYWDEPSPPPSGPSSGSGALNPPTGSSGTSTGTSTGLENRIEYSSQKKVNVTSVEELEEATRWWHLLTKTALIRLELSGVDEEQSKLMQSTIDRYMGVCGCHEGKIGVAFAVALFFFYTLIEALSNHPTEWAAIMGTGIVVAIMGALIGKITGVFRARISLQKEIQKLSRSLHTE